MTILAESLKRIYLRGNVTEEKIREMCDKGKITEDELAYILNT